MKVGFIGTGNMAKAMIEGYINAGNSPASIYISGTNAKKNKELQDRLHVTLCESNAETTIRADLLVIAVKPHIYETVMEEVKSNLSPDKVVVCIAAGITIDKMESVLGKSCKIVRTMPNTPSMVGEGMTAYVANANVTEEDIQKVLKLLQAMGKAEAITEKIMDAVVGVSGSSPAYVYMFIEALADGGVAQGMPRDKAYTFAAQAVLGAAKMVLHTGMHPGALKDAVCSPGGATIDAVAALERAGLRASVLEAVKIASEKSRKMSEGN